MRALGFGGRCEDLVDFVRIVPLTCTMLFNLRSPVHVAVAS